MVFRGTQARIARFWLDWYFDGYAASFSKYRLGKGTPAVLPKLALFH